jgi:hypothetical protein
MLPAVAKSNDLGESINDPHAINLETLNKKKENLYTLPEITPAEPFNGELDLNKIVTADLESIITPEGLNSVYMAAWYNGKDSQIFDITSYDCNTEVMLKDFWLDLINHNRESILYFHNWAGYDSILSLIPLLGLHEHGFSYTPIMQDGQLISLTVYQEIQGTK